MGIKMKVPKNPLALIPTQKLEQIHYIQLKVIEQREKSNKRDGKKLGLIDVFNATFLRDIFIEADKSFQGQGKEDLLGLHYYIAALNALPLIKVIDLEIETAREIKRRKELYRQKIDAGNLDKLIKEG
jgi:hypothetical protein